MTRADDPVVPSGRRDDLVANVSSNSEALVDVQNLSVRYPIKRGIVRGRTVGYVHAVDDVSLQIRRGETYGLVGESGCGKSSLGRAILKLEDFSTGRVVFDGMDLADLKGESLRRERRRMQMIFQDPLGSLNPRQSVESLLTEGMRAHGLTEGRRAPYDRSKELLSAVGVPTGSMTKYPHEFSGGQRQRIGLARALSVRPDLIVADEPVSALDVSVRAQVVNLLADLQSDLGLTYLLIAHDLAVVRHVSDRVGVMYLGGLVEEANSDDLYARPLHPYTKALISAAPVPDPVTEDSREQIVLTGDLPSPTDPPPGCPFHTRCPWRQETKCDSEPPPLREIQLGTTRGTRRVACHWVEGIERGEITPVRTSSPVGNVQKKGT